MLFLLFQEINLPRMRKLRERERKLKKKKKIAIVLGIK